MHAANTGMLYTGTCQNIPAFHAKLSCSIMAIYSHLSSVERIIIVSRDLQIYEHFVIVVLSSFVIRAPQL